MSTDGRASTRDMPTLPISVVFIHGTWASGSAWPLLEAGIRQAFGGEQVALQYLNWSGRNTVSARLSAAENLAHLLEADGQHRPTARRFIIAHSHGGAVALLGMRDAALRQAVAGIICLSTPFLLIRPRSFSELGSSVATIGLVLTWALKRGAEVWIIALISSFIAVILLQEHVTQQGVPYPFIILFVPMLVVFLTIFVAGLLIIPAWVINALALLPFGPEFSIFSPFIEVSAESTPPGACRAFQLSWESQPAIGETVTTSPPGGTGPVAKSNAK